MTRMCVGRTLRSDAFDFDFNYHCQTATKTNFKSVGQECPTHTFFRPSENTDWQTS